MRHDPLSKLIGCSVQKAELLNETTLVLTTDRGEAVLHAEGDCCSESWWSDLEVPRLPGVICRVDSGELDVPDGMKPERQECIDLTFLRIDLAGRGTLTATVRNESNGYYGGGVYLECRW